MATKDKWQAKESAQKNHHVNLLSACMYQGDRRRSSFQMIFVCWLAAQ